MRPYAIILALSLLTGCLSPVTPQTTPEIPAVHGRVTFTPTYGVQAGIADEIALAATVSLINVESGATEVTTLTDAQGKFSLTFPKTFVVTKDKPYYLEAVKGLKDLGPSNRVGADAARVRTILTWSSGNWKSISAGGITVNPSTTALSAIANLRALSTTSATALIDALRVGLPEPDPAPPSPDSFNTGAPHGVSSQEFHTVRSLVSELLKQDLDPLAHLSYYAGVYSQASGEAWQVNHFMQGTKDNLAVAVGGHVQLGYAIPPAPVPGSMNEEVSFAAQGVAPNAAGVVATDGTHLYVKSWNGYAVTNGQSQVFKKIGTGFNGTVQGQNYGTIATETVTSLGALVWNGKLFNPTLVNNQLERIDLQTGVMDTMTLAAPWLTRQNASPTGGSAAQLTTDGTMLYSLSFGNYASGNGVFDVRVLDPADDFSLVRDIRLSTATGSYYADGVVSDGIYVFPIEWSPGAPTGPKLRRYRLSDGQLEQEWTFSQLPHTGTVYNAAARDPISGQYDWVNNKFWVGNLTNEIVHRIKGGTFQAAGSFVSPPYDTGKPARYSLLRWGGDVPAGTSVKFQIRSADTQAGLSAVAWYGPTGTGDFYTTSGQAINAIHSGKRWVQVRATLATTDTATKTPRLRWFKVDYR
ncbi:hypothetical protein D3C72_197190 [compost metagenome]